MTRASILGSMAAAALLAGGMTLQAERPAIMSPRNEVGEVLSREERKRRRKWVFRAGRGRRGPMAERGLQATPFSRVVNGMTNWQRNQWARHGYPGLSKKEIHLVLPYLSAREREASAA